MYVESDTIYRGFVTPSDLIIWLGFLDLQRDRDREVRRDQLNTPISESKSKGKYIIEGWVGRKQEYGKYDIQESDRFRRDCDHSELRND